MLLPVSPTGKCCLLLSVLQWHLCLFIEAFCIGNYHLSIDNNFQNFQKSNTLSDQKKRCTSFSLESSFYDDFEDFGKNDDEDEEEEDDEEDEYEDDLEDAAAIAEFRARMDTMLEGAISEDGDSDNDDGTLSSVDELIKYATAQGIDGDGDEQSSKGEWAKPVDKLEGGVILLANPSKFCTDIGDDSSPSPSLLAKFGLTLPPPADLGPDRRADLLPVLVLLEKHPLRGAQAVLLNRRTGYLLGDLEQPSTQEEDGSGGPWVTAPRLGAFMIQPLWFGGTSAGGTEDGSINSSGGSSSSGLDMLHLCPGVVGAKQLTEDGLFWGGDPEQAQEIMNDPSLDRPLTGFDFKFFVQSTRWFPMKLEKEVRDGTWIAANVSKEVLFKSRDRMGTRRAKPLWTEIMTLLGGEYKAILDQLYENEM